MQVTFPISDFPPLQELQCYLVLIRPLLSREWKPDPTSQSFLIPPDRFVLMLPSCQHACTFKIWAWIAVTVLHLPVKTFVLLCTEAPHAEEMPGLPPAEPCCAVFCLLGHNYCHHLLCMCLTVCSCPWRPRNWERIMQALQCHIKEFEFEPRVVFCITFGSLVSWQQSTWACTSDLLVHLLTDTALTYYIRGNTHKHNNFHQCIRTNI